MAELTITQQLSAKSLATEVALLALLREKRDDVAFWDGMDKLMQIVLSLDNLRANPDPGIQAMADSAQEFLDNWRLIAGADPHSPAPPGAGPFQPAAGG